MLAIDCSDDSKSDQMMNLFLCDTAATSAVKIELCAGRECCFNYACARSDTKRYSVPGLRSICVYECVVIVVFFKGEELCLKYSCRSVRFGCVK